MVPGPAPPATVRSLTDYVFPFLSMLPLVWKGDLLLDVTPPPSESSPCLPRGLPLSISAPRYPFLMGFIPKPVPLELSDFSKSSPSNSSLKRVEQDIFLFSACLRSYSPALGSTQSKRLSLLPVFQMRPGFPPRWKETLLFYSSLRKWLGLRR